MKNTKTIRILAIESSCDETSASIVEAKLKVKNEKRKIIDSSLTANSQQPIAIDILSNVVSSQVKLHAKYGGVYPELASREHIRNVIPVIKEAINIAKFPITNDQFPINSQNSNVPNIENSKIEKLIENCKLKIENSVDAIAVTVGPGLIGSLLVGVNTAKTLAYALNKPIYAINHLEGHIYSAFSGEFPITNDQFPINSQNSNVPNIENLKIGKLIENCKLKIDNLNPRFPLVALVVSGGHTSIVYMKDHMKFKVVGETLDDAAGEAFDKVAKMLDLGYPGGPAISALAEKFSVLNSQFSNKSQSLIENCKLKNEKLFSFPRPMINSNDFDFSFSGLKTSVLYTVKKLKANPPATTAAGHVGRGSYKLKAEICYEFQEAVVDTLVTKTLRAAKKYKAKSVLLCGGVSANSRLREEFAYRISHIAHSSAGEVGCTNDKQLAISHMLKFFVPDKKLSTDNAAMIGLAAAYKIALGIKPTPWQKINADSNLKIKSVNLKSGS